MNSSNVKKKKKLNCVPFPCHRSSFTPWQSKMAVRAGSEQLAQRLAQSSCSSSCAARAVQGWFLQLVQPPRSQLSSVQPPQAGLRAGLAALQGAGAFSCGQCRARTPPNARFALDTFFCISAAFAHALFIVLHVRLLCAHSFRRRH